MKINARHSLFIGCALSMFCLEADYVRRELKTPTNPGTSVTYVVDDESYSVTLSPEDVQFIGGVLKPHVAFDRDYNKPIDKSFIKKVVGTCQCGDKRKLLERVLTDFKGIIVERLYSKLGLPREI
jgi:hypothetical protein